MKKNRILLNCLRIAPPGRALWTLLVIATLFMAPALSQTAFAESVAPTNITISKKGVSLEQLLWEIRKQCNFQFVYGTKDVDEYKNITIDVKNATVGEVLQKALAGTSLYYEIKDNVVYIKKKDQQPAKPKTIKGTVTDEKGAPLAGATVMVKGTKFITASDGSGNFSITIPGDITPILQISFIGMKTREEKILKDIVKFVLQADALQMGEVVVYSTGYQKIDKRLSTSSIFFVKNKSFAFCLENSLNNDNQIEAIPVSAEELERQMTISTKESEVKIQSKSILYSQLTTIKSLLASRIPTSTGETRDHYKYLLYQIDKLMK